MSDIQDQSKELTLHTITIILNALQQAYDKVETGDAPGAMPYVRYAGQSSAALFHSLQEYMNDVVTHELVDEGYRDLAMRLLEDHTDAADDTAPGQYM